MKGNLKIILTGAHGTGKTSVLRYFEELGCPVLSEVVRKLAERGTPINENGTCTTQHLVFNTYKRLLEVPGSIISDRGLTDVLAYTMTAAELHADPELKDLVAHQQRTLRESNAVNNYLYIYFPIQFGIENDGVRSTDDTYQKAVDRNLKHILDHVVGKYETIPPDLTPEERAKYIIDLVGPDNF